MKAKDLTSIIAYELRMSQGQFARTIGVSEQTVSNWINERHPIPLWVDRFTAVLVQVEKLRDGYRHI